MVGAQQVRIHYPVALREPVPHRRRDFVDAGIGAGDQRAVPAPGGYPPGTGPPLIRWRPNAESSEETVPAPPRLQHRISRRWPTAFTSVPRALTYET